MGLSILCVVLVLSGAALLFYSILEYTRSLRIIQNKTSAKKMFTNWMYVVSYVAMLLVLCGAVAMSAVYFSIQPVGRDILTSAIFLLLAIAVFVLVRIEERMSNTLFNQTGETVRMLVNAMETKDKYTRGHSDHVLNITRLFYNNLPEPIKANVNMMNLLNAAILHDIGKIGIDDSILNKTGPLTAEEWSIVRMHPARGKEILQNTSYQVVGEIIRLHHERVDGKGYYGVPGEYIPMEARIITIADAFSALYTNRVYRTKATFNNAMEVIKEEAGAQFDETLVDVFVNLSQEDLDAAGYVFQERISYVK